jgi:hypothetical protein
MNGFRTDNKYATNGFRIRSIGGGSLWHLLRVLHQPNLYHSCCQDDRCLTLTKPVSEHQMLKTAEPLILIIYERIRTDRYERMRYPFGRIRSYPFGIREIAIARIYNERIPNGFRTDAERIQS